MKSLIIGTLCFLAFTFLLPRKIVGGEWLKSFELSKASVRHIEAGGIGYSRGYTTFEAFLIPDPQLWKIVPFLDLRRHIFDNGKGAANIGIGIRGSLGKWVCGGNVYYDHRATRRQSYKQIGLGLEVLGTIFDIRLNGYLPAVEKDPFPWLLSPKHNKAISIQYPMKGANIEAGFPLGKVKEFLFYAALGSYYFVSPWGSNPWGGKARVNASYKDYMIFEVSNSYDSVFHNNFQGQVSLSFPLGPKAKASKVKYVYEKTQVTTDRLLKSVNREEIIVLSRKKKLELLEFPNISEPVSLENVFSHKVHPEYSVDLPKSERLVLKDLDSPSLRFRGSPPPILPDSS